MASGGCPARVAAAHRRRARIYDAVLRKLTLLYRKGLLDVDVAPVYTWRAPPTCWASTCISRAKKLRDLLRALEEKERLVELLNRVLEQPTGSLEVRVGLEEAHPHEGVGHHRHFLPDAEADMGKIAVLGPCACAMRR